MRALLAACLLTALTACSSAPDLSSLENAANEDRSAAQALADKLLGEVQGRDNRGLRLCMIAAGFSEVLVDRIQIEPDQAPTALGHLVQLKGIVQQFDNASPVFFNTDVQLVVLQMTSILVDTLKTRVVTGLLPNLAGGINAMGLAERAKIAARQASIAGAVVRDIRELMQNVQTGSVSISEGRTACHQRLDRNHDRVAAIMGAVTYQPDLTPGIPLP